MAGHAAVDEADPPLVQYEDVAGMRIGVAEPILHAHPEDGVGAVQDNGAAFLGRQVVGCQRAEHPTPDLFKRQHAACRVIVVDLRKGHGRVVLEQGTEPIGRLRLRGEIELLAALLG